MTSIPKNPVVIIPARLASTRLPDKPLADIHGAPMIVHVWRRAMAAGIGPVVVACAEEAIAEAVRGAGGRAVLTDPDHPSGSDRVFEAVQTIDAEGRHDAVVNVQGDLPSIAPEAIQAVLRPLSDPAVDIATLAAELADEDERRNPNVVKLAADFSAPQAPQAGEPPGEPPIARVLYFSRTGAPPAGGEASQSLYHHIGLYAFRREVLERFVGLPATAMEQRERLEQLRAMEAGMRIDVALVDSVPFGVDTPADLARARELLAPPDA